MLAAIKIIEVDTVLRVLVQVRAQHHKTALRRSDNKIPQLIDQDEVAEVINCKLPFKSIH